MGKRRGPRPWLVEEVGDKIFKDWVSGKPEGESLPPAVRLTKQYAVSRHTIHAALKRLVSQELIEQRHSAGAVVLRKSIDRLGKFRNKSLLVIFSKTRKALGDSFNQEIFRGLFDQLYDQGINLTVSSMNWQNGNVQQPKDLMQQSGIAGVFLVGRQTKNVLASVAALKRKPIVSVDWDATAKGIHSHCMDNAHAAEYIARRLYLLGHRRIVMLSESKKRPARHRDAAWEERRTSFLAAWKDLGAPKPIELPLYDRTVYPALLKQIAEILSRPQAVRPTGVVMPSPCGNHVQWALERAGIAVPSSVSLFAYTHNKSSTTSMRFDAWKLGMSAAEFMLQLLENPKAKRHKPKVTFVKAKYCPGKTHAKVATH